MQILQASASVLDDRNYRKTDDCYMYVDCVAVLTDDLPALHAGSKQRSNPQVEASRIQMATAKK